MTDQTPRTDALVPISDDDLAKLDGGAHWETYPDDQTPQTEANPYWIDERHGEVPDQTPTTEAGRQVARALTDEGVFLTLDDILAIEDEARADCAREGDTMEEDGRVFRLTWVLDRTER